MPALWLIASRRPLVIGHRGSCQLAPENTLPSFKLAMDAGADLVELDYRHTKEGVPVVIHDAELDRTTDAFQRWKRRHLRVVAKTAAEIQCLDAGRWFGPRFAGAKVPLLTEALDFILPSSVALIERKAGDAATCTRLLREKGLINRVIVQSFDWEFLRSFHQQELAQVLGALGPARVLPGGKRPFGISRKLNVAWLNQARKTGAKVVVWSQKVSKGSVRLAHERGFRVWVYTVNNQRQAKLLLAAGVDGLITNYPHLIRHTVGLRSIPTT